MKEKIKLMIEKAWLFAKGNKTIFLSILWGMIEAGLISITGGWLLFVRIVLSAFGVYSLNDHRKSGFFTANKMVVKDSK